MYHGDSHLHVVARAQQAHAPPELRSRDLGALMAFGRRVLAEDGEEVRVGYHLLRPCLKVNREEEVHAAAAACGSTTVN